MLEKPLLWSLGEQTGESSVMYPQGQEAFGKIENLLKTTHTSRETPNELRMEADVLQLIHSSPDIRGTQVRTGQEYARGRGAKPSFWAHAGGTTRAPVHR